MEHYFTGGITNFYKSFHENQSLIELSNAPKASYKTAVVSRNTMLIKRVKKSTLV